MYIHLKYVIQIDVGKWSPLYLAHKPCVTNGDGLQSVMPGPASLCCCVILWGMKALWWYWPWPWFIPYPTGHIWPHSDAIRVCQELPPLLPPMWTPSFVGLCWLRPSISLLVDLVLSSILWPYSRKSVRQKSCVRRSYAKFTTARVIHETCCTYDIRKVVV